MFLGLVMLAIIYFLYVLIVRGTLWRIIIAFFGWIGMYLVLATIPGCREYPLHNDSITWAALIPTLVILLAMATTREE